MSQKTFNFGKIFFILLIDKNLLTFFNQSVIIVIN